jgi:hypothetical protein
MTNKELDQREIDREIERREESDERANRCYKVLIQKRDLYEMCQAFIASGNRDGFKLLCEVEKILCILHNG